MTAAHFTLSQPERRSEMTIYLQEVASPDPRLRWAEERAKGLASGIDEVFHFIFDDNDFDETAIGVTLRNGSEVAAIQEVKGALESILDSVGDGNDEEFASHYLWPKVRAAALKALEQMSVDT